MSATTVNAWEHLARKDKAAKRDRRYPPRTVCERCGGDRGAGDGRRRICDTCRLDPRSCARDFWSRADCSPELSCWPWTRAHNLRGYGLYRVGVETLAPRVAWRIVHGDIPEGLNVLHRCDNPPCVRPDHLFLGTTADNAADMVAKGRHHIPSGLHGETNPFSKLTADSVRSIRLRHASGETQRAIAADLGVTPAAVSLVINGRTWRSVK